MRDKARTLIIRCVRERTFSNRKQLTNECIKLRNEMLVEGFSKKDALLIGLEAYACMPNWEKVDAILDTLPANHVAEL